MARIDVVEIYRHLKTYGVRVNGMRYPLDPLGAGVLAPVQPLPIALVVRVDDLIDVVPYASGTDRASHGDAEVIDHVAALVRSDADSDHDRLLTTEEDEDGLSPFAGGFSGETLLGLQRYRLNESGDGIRRNF